MEDNMAIGDAIFIIFLVWFPSIFVSQFYVRYMYDDENIKKEYRPILFSLGMCFASLNSIFIAIIMD